MKLTKREQAMVAQLRKQCESWRTHRKLNIAVVLTFVVVMASGIDFSTFPRLPSLNEMSHGTLLRIGFIIFWVGEVIRNWNGSPADVLLLRLIDEATEKHTEPAGLADDTKPHPSQPISGNDT